MDSDDTSSQDLSEIGSAANGAGKAVSRGVGQKGVATTRSRSVMGMTEMDDMKLEDEINLSHLTELMKIFHEADENGSDGLDIDEFRNAFGEILGKGKDERQMNILFMKIDTNCDGTVDWDEFCTYMLLEYQEKDVMGRSDKENPFSSKLRIIHSPHHDAVSCMCWLQNARRRCDGGIDEQKLKDGRYVMVSKEGVACFWNSEMTVQKTVILDYPKPKKMWVTDCIALSNVNKIAVATTDNDICFYDLAAGLCERQYHITALPASIQCMDYWFNPFKLNYSILTFGDMGGNVGAFIFHRATQGLFAAKKQDHCLRIPFVEVLKQKRAVLCTAVLFDKVHNDWSKKVKYCHGLDSFMSCSCDSKAAIVLGSMCGRSDRTHYRIPKGVNAFDYSQDWNCIVTGGIDRLIRIWSPHVSSKPTSVMKGHNVAITHVTLCEKDALIYSLSKDKMFKVWDLRDQSCIQTIARLQSLGSAPVSIMFYNTHSRCLVMAASQVGILDPNNCELTDHFSATSHEKPVRAALYNSNFNQVVSGCSDSVVCVWDVETGQKVMQFSQVHGDAEITAMAFDPTERRLVTAGRDGTVKTWNFNNGACLGELDSPDICEITSIVCPPDRICTGGWSRRVVVHSDVRTSDNDQFPRPWKTIHNEDILCMSFCPPNLIATGSYDGDVLIWNMEMESICCQLNASGTCKTIMQKPKAARSAFQPIVHTRSFIETQLRPNEELSSGLRLVFQEKKASRKYSITSDLGLSEEDMKLLHLVELKKLLPSCMDLHESNDISSLMESAVMVSHYSKGREKKHSLPDLPTTLEKVDSQAVEITMDEKQINKTLLDKDSEAIEQVLFLSTREHDSNTAIIVSAGAGGWIRFWNIYGGGLLGEFVGLHYNHPEFSSILAMTTDTDNVLLFTGCTQGYIKNPFGVTFSFDEIWDISNYCISSNAKKHSCDPHLLPVYSQLLESKKAHCNSRIPLDSLPAKPKYKSSKFKGPPLLCSWRAHLKGLSSLSFVKDKELVISASNDCTVRLWTACGKYIGTFGQRNPWQIPEPTAQKQHMPKDITGVASEYTLKVMKGQSTSRWILAKNLFRSFRVLKMMKKDVASTTKSGDDGFQDELLQTQARKAFEKAYKRRTRVKKPHHLPKLRQDTFGHFLIYPELQCSELADVTKFKQLPSIAAAAGGHAFNQSFNLQKAVEVHSAAKGRLCGAVKAVSTRLTFKGKMKLKFNEQTLFGTSLAKEAK